MKLVQRTSFLILILAVVRFPLSEGLECHSCESSPACFSNPGKTVKCTGEEKYCVTGVHAYYIFLAFRRCMTKPELDCLTGSYYPHKREFKDKCVNMYRGGYEKCFDEYKPDPDGADCEDPANVTTVTATTPKMTNQANVRRRRESGEVAGEKSGGTESSVQSAPNQEGVPRDSDGGQDSSGELGFPNNTKLMSIVSLCYCETDLCNNFTFSFAIWTSRANSLIPVCAALVGYMLAH